MCRKYTITEDELIDRYNSLVLESKKKQATILYLMEQLRTLRDAADTMFKQPTNSEARRELGIVLDSVDAKQGW